MGPECLRETLQAASCLCAGGLEGGAERATHLAEQAIQRGPWSGYNPVQTAQQQQPRPEWPAWGQQQCRELTAWQT